MFRVETTRTIDKELISKNNLSFPDLIIDSLKTIGFIKIKKQGNSISFKHYFKDTNVESFQRRYGSGSLSYILNKDTASISIVTENTVYLILSILGNAFVFFAVNYQFIFKSKESISFIIIFNAVLILFNVFGIWRTKMRYKNKQQDLLTLLETKMNEIAAKTNI